MGLHLGEPAPNFQIETSKGPIDLYEWMEDSWCFFFSHPADFTPVCTTEMGQSAKMAEDFSARNVKLLGLSTDTAEEHLKWIADVNETQNTELNFPIVADKQFKVSRLYDMLHWAQSDTETVRTVFIIDPNKLIRLTMTYPMNIGRNIDEVLRVIDAMQLADKHNIATPVNWQQGDSVIIPPSVDSEEAERLFPQGWDEKKPYLRIVDL